MSSYTTFKIREIKKENYRVSSFILDNKIEAEPGQFLMVWIPGIDEKPFGIAVNDPLTLTIAKAGPFSKELHKLKEGDEFSFKGPLGTSFNLNNKKEIVLVAGGYGAVPLYFLAKRAEEKGINSTIILGAQTKKDLIYEEKFKESGCEVHICTDDGSCGTKGFATAELESLLKEKKFDKLYSCGPDPMMKSVAKISDEHNLDYEFSLEAYMKCGIGICGTCTIGDKLVCKDGPVFTKTELKEMNFIRKNEKTKH